MLRIAAEVIRSLGVPGCLLIDRRLADRADFFFSAVGAFVRHRQRRDLLRAVMEGVSYSLRDCLEVLSGMGVAPKQMLACGGGGKSPLWRQMLAAMSATRLIISTPAIFTRGLPGRRVEA